MHIYIYTCIYLSHLLTHTKAGYRRWSRFMESLNPKPKM